MTINLTDGSIAHTDPLPLTAEGVTATWLSAGLRTRYPGVVVTEVEPVQIIDGIATKIRLWPGLPSAHPTRRPSRPDGQPADVNTATYAGFGMAMIDHDTYAELGV